MKITKEGFAVIEGDNCISKWVESEGRLDHDQNMLPRVLPYIKKGDTVIDAGAYIGDHTIAYSKQVGESGTIIAFEPSNKAFECLKHNLKTSSNAILFNKGLGIRNEVKSIVEVSGNDGMNHLISGEGVEITTIDSLHLEKIDFIKIDVEGMELDILIGAIETLKKFKPKLLIEINDYTLKAAKIERNYIFSLLDELGYKYENIYNDQDLKESQMDIICIPINENFIK